MVPEVGFKKDRADRVGRAKDVGWSELPKEIGEFDRFDDTQVEQAVGLPRND